MDKKQIGQKAEELAASYLEQEGMTILRKNYYTRQGELDLIAWEDQVLVFVEVKARRDNRCGYPAESITLWKKRRICHAARVFCMKERMGTDCQIRFDVVEVLGDRIRHIRNAFDYVK